MTKRNISENNLRVFSGRQDVRLTFQNAVLSGIRNISAEKISFLFNGETFERRIKSQVLTIESLLKLFNAIFRINDTQIISFEMERNISPFVAYLNVKYLTHATDVRVTMSKYLACKLGFMPYHEMMCMTKLSVDIILNQNTSIISNLLCGLYQIHLRSSDLCCHNNYIVSSFSLAELELTNNLIGLKPAIYKNLSSFIYLDRISPKNVHFSLVTDMGEPFNLQYCRVTVKCQKMSKRK